MNKPRQIVLKLMERRGMTRAAVARAVGINIRTFENVLSGSQSKIARQRISALFGEENIWPSMATYGHLVRFPAGAEMDFETAEQAHEFSRAFGSTVTIAGRSIRFAVPTRFAVQLPIAIRETTKGEKS